MEQTTTQTELANVISEFPSEFNHVVINFPSEFGHVVTNFPSVFAWANILNQFCTDAKTVMPDNFPSVHAIQDRSMVV